MATCSSVLAWKIPWTEEPGGLQSMGSQRVGLECALSHVQPFAAPWTVAHKAPLSKGFSRQEHWSRLPFPSPGDPPDQGMEPASLRSPALVGRFLTTSATWEDPIK